MTTPNVDQVVAAALGGDAGSMLPSEVGIDAQADLANALVLSTVQVSASAVRAMAFIREYLGPTDGPRLIQQTLRDKRYQNPSAPKLLVGAIKALSLYDHLKGFNLSLGGK